MHIIDPCPFCSKVGFRPLHERADDKEGYRNTGVCHFSAFTDGTELASGETIRKIDKVYEETGECPPHHWERIDGPIEDLSDPEMWECKNCGETVP